MKSVALYARVSSERQAQQATIESQVVALRERVAGDGHIVLPNDIYIDDGYSGSTLRRPALERLRDRLAEGGIDILYLHSADRLARRYAHQVLLLEEFAAHHVQVMMVHGKNGETPEDELLVQVQGVIAEYERAKILERSRRGKIHKARQGVVNPLVAAPYGYRYIKKSDGANATYQISLPEAKVVRRIFDTVVRQQRSLRQVARMLNEERVPTRGTSSEWNLTAIHEVLGNPAYMGKAAFGRTQSVERTVPLRLKKNQQVAPRHTSARSRPAEEWISIPVPPIVSEEIFAAAKEQLERNRKLSQRNRSSDRYLVSGLTVCARCSYAYYGKTIMQWTRKKDRKVVWSYYRCSGADARRPGGAVCGNRPVRVDQLDDHVWQSVRALLRDPTRVMNEWRRRAETQPDDDDRADVLRSVHAQERALKRLLDAYEAGVLELDDLKLRSERLRQKLDHSKRALEELDKRRATHMDLKLVITRVEEFAERVRRGLNRIKWQERQAIIRALVARIDIDEDGATIVYRVPASPAALIPAPPPQPELGDCVGGMLTHVTAAAAWQLTAEER